MKKTIYTTAILCLLVISHNTVFAQGVDCDNDDALIASVFNTLSDCDQVISYLVNNYNFTEEEACAWDGAGFSPDGFQGAGTLGNVCECSCQTAPLSCDEGYTLLTLNYFDAAQNSFTVTNSIAEEMATYSDLNGDGTIQDCFLTSAQNDCFSIDVDGGQNFSWYLSVGDVVLLQGGASDFEFGPDCDEDCNDDDALVEQYFGNFFVTECSALIDYLVVNYNYTQSQACNWDGTPMANFGGLIISDFCECSCQENVFIENHNRVLPELIMIKDLMGRDVNQMIKNTPLLLIYKDGSIKKTMIKTN